MDNHLCFLQSGRPAVLSTASPGKGVHAWPRSQLFNQQAIVAQTKVNRGKMLAIGPGKQIENLLDKPTFIDHQLKVGMEVIYSRYSGHDIEHDGKEVVIVSADDVLATVA